MPLPGGVEPNLEEKEQQPAEHESILEEDKIAEGTDIAKGEEQKAEEVKANGITGESLHEGKAKVEEYSILWYNK